MFNIVNRSRKDKISLHIRLPGFVVEREKLNIIAFEAARRGDVFQPNDESPECYKGHPLLKYLDCAIYREKGQLRISNNDIYYKSGMK